MEMTKLAGACGSERPECLQLKMRNGKDRLISEALAEVVVQKLAARAGFDKREITIEFQGDFQFLLVAVPYNRFAELSQQRRQLGLEIHQMMPKRDGELTWMLNFIAQGKVVDSYFGGDLTSPEVGL